MNSKRIPNHAGALSPVVFAGAIILGRSWLCDEHGTVQLQGTKCPECAA